MLDKQNLIFSLHGALYGISADCVREICWLPELYSLATAPIDIIGIFNWRSQMVPVMHLDLRFGRGFSGCNVTDRLIVVEYENTFVAIVAHEVYDVRTIAPVPLDLELIQNRQSQTDRNFILGIAQTNDEPVSCLAIERLIREPDLDAETPAVVAGTDLDFYSRCCPQANATDRATFASRAAKLKTSTSQTQSLATEAGVLAVQIGTQYLGLPLELVVDVDALDRFAISFVPAAPPYLLGQINWRSEILPVLELGGMFQLPPLPRQEIAIVEIDGIKMGIAVDRIFDVSYLARTEIEDLPLSINNRVRKYLSGITKYAESFMYAIDLQQLVKHEFLPDNIAA